MRLIGFASREERGIVVLDCKGELDMEFSVKLGGELFRILDEHPGRNMLLNIHEVDIINSYCLTLLLALRSRLEERGRRMAICSPKKYIKKILEFADFVNPFEIYENEDHAIDALSRQPGRMSSLKPAPAPSR
jgi:anti-anti-sigma factor